MGPGTLCDSAAPQAEWERSDPQVAVGSQDLTQVSRHRYFLSRNPLYPCHIHTQAALKTSNDTLWGGPDPQECPQGCISTALGREMGEGGKKAAVQAQEPGNHLHL